MPRNYNDQMKIEHDFGWLDDFEENSQKYAEFCKTEVQDIASQVKIPFPPTYRLIRTELDGDDFYIALVCDSTEEIVYYIKCRVWEDVVLNAKPVTQVMLWRTNVIEHRRVTSGVAEEIFRSYLLEQYHVVASDSCQTREGRDFWVRQLGYALQYGEYVYRYHRIECDLQQITDHSLVRNNKADLWGDDMDYENVLAVISKNEIILG
ncbi:hypothetical protein [Vibrio sp. SCSIO 43136]|uniref:hypothetical protein n=1 Tax=Vibrio sp. SCSIO 43136 TaxID=2819101 RepID=UPI0020761593|nr:hypothetical protein [Vibrio sp. SCSIO 43136]USD64597.1 hypothetical protein J4N39_10845 [Vibrio sp. SCSIO 43136]